MSGLLIVAAAMLTVSGFFSAAHAESREEELNKLEKTVESLQKAIEVLNEKIEGVERARAQAAAAPPPAPVPVAEAAGPASPVRHRPAFCDQQEAAPRADDLTLDPAYRGFIPVPNTGGIMIQFNARPRVDFTYDAKNTGDDNRFVTAKIPVAGDPGSGDGPIANVNAKGSRLSVDVRAPRYDGSPRFYFQNDFFGSGSGEFNYRVRHIYGKIYNVVVGHTYGVFEDPDIWPDTVDYKGPNSMVLARMALLQYKHRLGHEWIATFGIEQPASSPDGTGVTGVNHAPDGGFNLRWENSGVGHAQFATVFRDIGARSATFGTDESLGWGTNLSAEFDAFSGDTVLGQVTCGEGIGSLGNDTTSLNSDAAFDKNGDLVALPYVGVFAGYTHRWADVWRSTATYGFVNLDPQASQGPDAYRQTHYASVNLIWQLRKSLSVGVEALYGHKETQGHAKGDAVRTQVGVLYSIF
jgi:hypothetical protein